MKKLVLLLCVMVLFFTMTGCEIHFKFPEFKLPEKQYGFAREIPEAEKTVRLQIVASAEKWLGCKESDGSFRPIIDLYNAHEPLAVGYLVQYSDEWCAAFVSAVAIECGLTDIIPTECGCQRQIALCEKLGCWEEDDAYIPLPGDYIFYATKNTADKNEAWSNHVGIVVGTNGNTIKVIEGNYNESVSYRTIEVDNVTIRGYGLPDYASVVPEEVPSETSVEDTTAT
jgi:hypothetical protein